MSGDNGTAVQVDFEAVRCNAAFVAVKTAYPNTVAAVLVVVEQVPGSDRIMFDTHSIIHPKIRDVVGSERVGSMLVESEHAVESMMDDFRKTVQPEAKA